MGFDTRRSGHAGGAAMACGGGPQPPGRLPAGRLPRTGLPGGIG